MAKYTVSNEPSTFSLKTPKVSQGRVDNYVAATDLMTVSVKIYASGGENAMHQHPHEDHAFIVMEGQATFHVGTDDNIKVCNRNEGIMLPKGTNYWFLSSAPENLVMLRMGAARERPENWRTFPDGRPFLDRQKKENKETEAPVLAPGQFFAG